MNIYLQAAGLPIVFEFTGDNCDLDSVSLSVRYCIERRYVHDLSLQNNETGAVEQHLLTNFAALPTCSVRATDPRQDQGWDDRMVFSQPLVDFMQVAVSAVAQRDDADAT